MSTLQSPAEKIMEVAASSLRQLIAISARILDEWPALLLRASNVTALLRDFTTDAR